MISPSNEKALRMTLRRLWKLSFLVLGVIVAAVAAGSAFAGNSWSSGPAIVGRYASTSDCPAYSEHSRFCRGLTRATISWLLAGTSRTR